MRTEALGAFAEHGISLAEVQRALEILDAARWPELSEEEPGLARLLKREYEWRRYHEDPAYRQRMLRKNVEWSRRNRKRGRRSEGP